MARKKIVTPSFMSGLEAYANEVLTDGQKVNVAKKSYLEENREEILNALKRGYAYGVIAKYATMELLKTDILHSCTVKNKEGEEVTVETRIAPADIKKLVEQKEDN